MSRRFARAFAALAATLALAACSTPYIPPGPKADLRGFAPGGIDESLAAKPAARFPAGVAVVRVQAPSYTNYRLQQGGGTVGSGQYAIVLAREAGEDAQLDRIARLPGVAGVTGLNRMLLPTRLEGDRPVREAAARLQADLVFLYTFDTSFADTDAAKPLSVITLGLSPTRHIRVSTTVSALLLDTRTGYVYATSEATKASEMHATSWGSSDAADDARRDNEREAFAQMIDDFCKSWPKLAARYQAGS